ncbi:MAG: SusC/RagA family TonB-linked outer membrane protein [Bacteroidota bacterium]|nr:SusC/RagA family TonB-linked outer membrane protein [Bacteroidota bacterium]
MRKIATLFTMLMLFSALAFGQNRTISGTVTNEKGDPVPGASITIKGTRTGVSADNTGEFRILAKTGDILVASSSGMETAESTVGTGSSINFSIKTLVIAGTEVVVTALGINRQKKELGYATAKINSEELTKAKAVNIANGLQGKVSGLNITSVNNGVFEDVKINLRGIRSLLGNNNPMLLLDGVPVALSNLSSLNPNDIADVNILKGTSAAAIYGPDAVNGVIVVTTKKGTRTGAPVVNVGHSTQVSRISFFPEFQFEFGSGGYGDYIPYENWSWGPAFDGNPVEIGRHLPNGSVQTVPYTPLRNEKRKFFNSGVTIQNDVSLSAKDFFISVQDAIITGIVPDDKNRRTGIRMNTGKEYGKFRVQFNTNYIQTNYNVFDDDGMGAWNAANNVGLNGGLMNLIFNTPAHIPLRSYKNFLTDPFATYTGFFNDYGLNPYFALDNWRQFGRNDDLLTNVELGLKATSWLNLTYRAAATVNSSIASTTSKGEDEFAERSFKQIPGAVSETSDRSSRVSSEFFANATKTVGDFKFTALLGQYFRQTDRRNTNVNAPNLIIPNLFNVGSAAAVGGSSNRFKTRLISLYGSVGIGFRGWANIEFTGRRDKSSLLAPENRNFFYPGVSGAIVLSEAIPTLKESKVISFLKLRGSYNKTGNINSIGAYGLAATFSQASGFPFSGLPGYTGNNSSPDPLLKPEFVKAAEVGFELGMLKNRINLEATFFTQDNTDQIIPIRVSDATGYTTATVNAASFTNRGVEIDLRLTPLVKLGKANIDFKANATYNTSEISSVFAGLDEVFAGGFDNFAANYVVKGQPAFIFKATDWKRDDLGRVIVDRTTGYPDVDPSPKNFGRTMPTWIVGLNPSFSWKGLVVSVLGEYKGGHFAYHGIGEAMAWTGISKQTAVNHRERFVFPNSVYEDPNNAGKYLENTNIQIANVNDYFTGPFRDVATNFLTSAAAWRIREVSIGYEVPARLFGKSFIKGVSVALTGRNLFLFLPESNEFSDPDFNFTTGNASGVSTSQINPPVRTFGASINLRF